MPYEVSQYCAFQNSVQYYTLSLLGQYISLFHKPVPQKNRVMKKCNHSAINHPVQNAFSGTSVCLSQHKNIA